MTTDFNHASGARRLDLQPKPERKRRQTVREPIPDGQADVALLDINDLKALTRMGRSWIHNAVRENEFPPPVIRESRCTRWSLAHVRAWLIERTAAATNERHAGDANSRRAKRASDAAKAKRACDADSSERLLAAETAE